MSIGDKIKELRKLNKLTQMELAKKSNISRSYLADVEKDRYNASVDTLQAIAKSLNVTVSELLGDNTVSPATAINNRDRESINKDLNTIMQEFREGTDGTAYYNGIELEENDLDLIESAMKIALEQIKIKNKDKYTPNKHKK